MHTYAANIHDTKSGIVADKQAYEKYPSIKKFRAGSGYRGTLAHDILKNI